MSVITIRGDLVDERALPAAAVVEGESSRLSHSQHVHSVHLDAGNVVAPRVESGRGGRSLLRRAHAVVVVLADKDDCKSETGHDFGQIFEHCCKNNPILQRIHSRSP